MLAQELEINEKALRLSQTLRAGCCKAERKILPRRRPLPWGAGRPKFNQHLQTQFGEDRCTQFRVIVVTNTTRPHVTNTHKHTDRTDYNTLRR